MTEHSRSCSPRASRAFFIGGPCDGAEVNPDSAQFDYLIVGVGGQHKSETGHLYIYIGGDFGYGGSRKDQQKMPPTPHEVRNAGRVLGLA